jgi:CRISPR-associated protein Cas1
MESLDGLVILGGGHITTEAIARCVGSGIRVAALTRGGKVRFVAAPELSGNVHLRVAQYEATSDPQRSLDLAKLVVAAKIANSRMLVRRWQWGGLGC